MGHHELPRGLGARFRDRHRGDRGLIRREGLQDGPAELSRKQAVQLITSWIQRRIPAAVIRFGEGEGRLLVADPADPESIRVAANKIRRQTGLRLSPEEVLGVEVARDERLRRGGRRRAPRQRVVQRRAPDVGRADHGLFEERLAQGREPAYVTHCMLNNSLRDSLRSLLEGQPPVSVISSRDVKATDPARLRGRGCPRLPGAVAVHHA